MDQNSMFTGINLHKIITTLYRVVIVLNLGYLVIASFLVAPLTISLSDPLLWILTVPVLLLIVFYLSQFWNKKQLKKIQTVASIMGKFVGILISNAVSISILQIPLLISTTLVLLYGNLIFGLYSLIVSIVIYQKVPNQESVIELLEN